MFGIAPQSFYPLNAFVAAAISGAMIAYLMPRRLLPSTRALLLLLASVAVWAFCYGMELNAPDLPTKLRWVRAEYLGAGWTALFFFRFAMVLSARSDWLSGRKGGVLFIVPVLAIAAAFSNDYHHLMWSRAWIDTGGPLPTLAYDRGWLFWAYVGYSYALLLTASVTLFHTFLASGRLERRNFALLMVGLAAPWGSNFLYLVGVEPFRYIDFTPLAFAVSGIAFFWGVIRHQILELVPIAREAVIESMQDAVFVLNLQDRVMDLNSAARQLAAGLEEPIIGRPLAAVAPTLSDRIEENRRAGATTAEITMPIGGASRLLHLHDSLLTIGGQTPCGRLITLQDITDQRQNEIALRESEEKFRSISANALDGIIMINPSGCVSFWNRAAEQIFGYRADEILGENLHTRLAPPSFHDRYHQAFTEFQRTGTGQVLGKTIEIQCLRKDGGQFPAELSLSPLRLNDQWHAVGIVRDISERKKTQEFLIQSEKMLSVGGLAAGMAHEINNPLAGILSNIQMMRLRLLGDLPANRSEAEECGLDLEALRVYMRRRGIFAMIDASEQSCQRAAGIVRNMLAFSRKGDTVFSNHDLADLLDQTVALASNDFNLRSHYDFRQIETIRRFSPDMPAIPCDGSQIQQVLLNILKNGAHAMWGQAHGNRPPRFILSTHLEPPYGCVTITDNGPGMPEAVQKRIFEPFYTTKPTGTGTGLGLSIAYFIVTEKHGGILSVSSRPDEGTTFTVKLPLHQRS